MTTTSIKAPLLISLSSQIIILPLYPQINDHMTIASVSIFRRSTMPSLLMFSTILRHISPSVISRQQNPNNVSRKIQQQPNKNLLKAQVAVKHLSSLSPALTPEHKPQLSQNQAIGMVTPAFHVCHCPIFSTRDNWSGVALRLCVLRALLKKIKRVLVRDKVLIGSIDWVDGRGMTENVFDLKSEILDPPVVNVDHLLMFFYLGAA